MITLRLALGWGMLCLAITPALAQTVDDEESFPHPFHEASIASFDGVWQEPMPVIQRRTSEVIQYSIELVAGQEPVIPGEDEAATPTLVAHSPKLLPIPIAQPIPRLPQRLAPTDAIQSAETGLLEWLLGMIGVVGVIALGGVYWIFHVRPALDVRHSTNRLRLSSALTLPRRSGLFLVDVEDHTVLVAMDGGSIRQVVPLRLSASRNKTGRHPAAGKAQHTSLSSTSDDTPASEEVAFHDVLQAQRAWKGDVPAVVTAAKFATRPQASAVQSSQAS